MIVIFGIKKNKKLILKKTLIIHYPICQICKTSKNMISIFQNNKTYFECVGCGNKFESI
jgi:Zn ribbon nucleic-acid-binding protein